MIVLGFQCGEGSHDSSAALVRDGALVAAVEEERFSRVKHDGTFPHHAIDYCLREAGATMADVDVVAYPHKPFRSGPDAEFADVAYAFLKRLQQSGRIRRRSLLHKRALDFALRAGVGVNVQMNQPVAGVFAEMRERYGPLPPVRFFRHHESHAAASYLTSGLERAAVVTIDGRGGLFATATWAGESGRIREIAAEPYCNSLGFFYEHVTRYLGLGAFGEGKTMGLASYGDARRFADVMDRILDVAGDAEWYRYRQPPSKEVVGFGPRSNEPILDGPYADFAAAAQQALERSVQSIARSAIERAECDSLCLSGGVALNCSANGALSDAQISSTTWIFPAVNDAGLSVGAALLASTTGGHAVPRERITHAYWGPAFSTDECNLALQREPRVSAAPSADVSTDVAKLLAAGNIIGWFQGRMELGPRALGNRSILADPRTVEMRDRVNRVKRRELWRPLAPVVLAERADEFFVMREPSPFMLFAAQVRLEARGLAPAIVHVDGSARPQTVERDQNPRLHSLLSAFERITGLPLLLNTSFNDAGEPIVCTPADAIRTFLGTDIDVLVLGDLIVRRSGTGG